MIKKSHCKVQVKHKNFELMNCFGLDKFVRYNQQYVVSEFVNVVNMDSGLKNG